CAGRLCGAGYLWLRVSALRVAQPAVLERLRLDYSPRARLLLRQFAERKPGVNQESPASRAMLGFRLHIQNSDKLGVLRKCLHGVSRAALTNRRLSRRENE